MVSTRNNCTHTKRLSGRLASLLKGVGGLFMLALLFFACSADQEHIAEAINKNDSLPFSSSRGISTLISDSGVIRYKLIAETWEMYSTTNPPTWKFLHGFFMERFDENMHTDLFVQADTAYLHKEVLWELRGRVIVKNVQGTLFLTQELFWDRSSHRMWNHMPMDIYSPGHELHGTEFRSNEKMTDYFVMNSAGNFPASETEDDKDQQAAAAASDTSSVSQTATAAKREADHPGARR